MERKKDAKLDLIRPRLEEGMLPLYDEAISGYNKLKIDPVFKNKLPRTGLVESLIFTEVPEEVMQRVFAFIEKAKPNLGCNYRLSYEIGKTKKDNKYGFEIWFDRSTPSE